jgi:uncharacterized repeat protein (TIGR03847 family)
MWIEKQDLNSLSLALDRFLALITEGQFLRVEARAGEQPAPQGMPADFPTHPTYDFQVGEMKLNYDAGDKLFLLHVTPLEIIMEFGREPRVELREEDVVSFVFTQHTAQELSTAIAQVVTAGRPVCPLCGTPLDGGPHACVKQNGHHQIILVEGEEEDGDEGE